MIYAFAADMLVIIHLGFVLFVVLGGFLAIRWRRIMFVHLPALTWGIVIEFTGWICPLTPWEQQLRRASGQNSYSGSFIAEYLVPTLYPEHLTRELQYGLGIFVILINLIAYAILLRKSRK